MENNRERHALSTIPRISSLAHTENTGAHKTSSNNGAASQFDLNQTFTVDAELAAKTEDSVKVAVHHSPAVSLDRIFR
jgi:hypothetical protein